jgi:type I restriction enzyme S subunit
MSDRIVKLSDLADENLLEIGAGRPRSAGLDRYPLPILRVADVLDGAIESSFQDYTPDTRRPTMGPKVSKPGDIILTTKGTVGRVAIMPAEGPNYAYSPQLCYFRPIANGPLTPRYLYYWFKSKEFWNQADALKGQTDMADFLSLSDIHSLKMRLPSVEEQTGIIEVLGGLDDKIAVNGRIAATCEELAVAIADQERWPSKIPLGSIVNHARDQVLPRNLDCAFVAHYSLPAFDAGVRPEIVQPDSIKSNKFLVAGPAILLSKLNPSTPRVWDVDPDSSMPALASTEFLVLRPADDLESSHIWAVCRQKIFTQELANKATGTSNSHQRARPDDILDISVTDPRSIPMLERCQIVSLIKRARLARQEVAGLAHLRDALLPKLMSGEIHVRDAEKVVEDAA